MVKSWYKFMVLGLKNKRFWCVNMPWNALQPQYLCGFAKIYTTAIYWYIFLENIPIYIPLDRENMPYFEKK